MRNLIDLMNYRSLQDAAKICKSVMERDPDDVRFSVMALAPTQL